MANDTKLPEIDLGSSLQMKNFSKPLKDIVPKAKYLNPNDMQKINFLKNSKKTS